MFRKNTIFVKKCGDVEILKNNIFTFTKNWVFKNNNVKELTDELDKELEINDIRNLTGGIYPEILSLAKSDYEILSEDKILDNGKILGMEVKLRNE